MRKHIRNANTQQEESLSGLDRLALWITNHVGTMGFFLIIFFWTVIWTGYNILASEVSTLHWTAFDPFPAFVAYLLISNVIQILLMPLIMVGQNLQNRHAEIRSENDFETNVRAEREVEAVLKHLDRQNKLLLALVENVGLNVGEVLKATHHQEQKKAEPTGQ